MVRSVGRSVCPWKTKKKGNKIFGISLWGNLRYISDDFFIFDYVNLPVMQLGTLHMYVDPQSHEKGGPQSYIHIYCTYIHTCLARTRDWQLGGEGWGGRVAMFALCWTGHNYLQSTLHTYLEGSEGVGGEGRAKYVSF